MLSKLLVLPACLVVIASAITCGPRKDAAELQKKETSLDADVASIIDALEKMPDWTVIPLTADRGKERERIEEAIATLATYRLDEIRQAIEKYSAEHITTPGRRLMEAQGKLLILNKSLFCLPERVRRDSPHFRYFGGGWLGLPVSGDPEVPRPSDEMDIRWPWSVEESGAWRLTGRYAGFNGVPYDALAAFDYYREVFGRRQPLQIGAASYFCQWRNDDTESWTVLAISAAHGREMVETWIRNHAGALERGEEMGPQLAWCPRDVLVEVRPDGTSQKHYLLRRYPIDARQPVATREYAVNISDEEINALRAIFVEHGVASERDFVDSADGG